MANQIKGGRRDNLDDISSREQSLRQEIQNMQEMKIRKCDHKTRGNNRVIGVHDVKNEYIRNKDRYSDTTGYCTRCKAIFETEAYDPEQVNAAIYMFNSMLHQIKFISQLTDEDWNTIDRDFSALDTLAGVAVYYNNMVEKMSSNSNKKGGRKNTKGHMGISSDMFGGRQY